jgi:hypothetical protein
MVFQERHAIRDGHLDSSIKSPPVFLLHDLLHRKFVVDSPPLHIMGRGEGRDDGNASHFTAAFRDGT